MAKTAAVDLHHGAGSKKKSDADRDANGRAKRICVTCMFALEFTFPRTPHYFMKCDVRAHTHTGAANRRYHHLNP